MLTGGGSAGPAGGAPAGRSAPVGGDPAGDGPPAGGGAPRAGRSLPDPATLGVSFPGFGDPAFPPAWLGGRLVDANLVLEGGAMRGQFTAGVLDGLMDADVFPTTCIGVSAGALHGANLKAGMRGRSCYLNMGFAGDWRYYSYRSWLVTGNVFSVRFSFDELPRRLVPFDFKSFRESPIRLFSVAADLVSGQADYHEYGDLDAEMDFLRASASMPFVSEVTQAGGMLLLDGGICDSVPIAFSLSLGSDRQVIVLTQPPGYSKPPNRLVWLARLAYRRYPRFVEALAQRHVAYNAALGQARQLERQGRAFVFQPSGANPVSNMERDGDKLLALYREGLTQAGQRLPELLEYLGL